jgi:hypothetical protein
MKTPDYVALVMKNYPLVFETRGARRKIFRYYRRRNSFPAVRMRARPGTKEFNALYDRCVAAETRKDFERIRVQVGMSPKPQKRRDYDEVDAWLDALEKKYGVR